MNQLNLLLTIFITKTKKRGLMKKEKSFMSQSRKSLFSATIICFVETVWTIGCSVVAGAIPALTKSQYTVDS